MATALDTATNAAGGILRVHYSHDAMIDLILGSPMVSQNEIAKHFGYTVPWVSRIINSDAFQARLAERKTELIDPVLAASMDEKLRAVAAKSLDVVLEKLCLPVVDGKFALEAAGVVTKALGYGARQQNLNVQQNFVVALPGKAASAETWSAAHTGALLRQAVSDISDAELVQQN